VGYPCHDHHQGDYESDCFAGLEGQRQGKEPDNDEQDGPSNGKRTAPG
jgi:hypothetical protein